MSSPKDESINRPFSSLPVSPKPDLQGYDHVTWYVGNAKMVASYFVTRFGFQRMAYQGLETGSRYMSSHVISNGGAVFVLTSPIQSLESTENIGMAEKTKLQEMYKHLEAHGDGVKDVAFQVDDVHAVYNFAVAQGATSIQLPISVHDKLDGEITTAVIKTYGDTTHTLVDRSKYRGSFLPGFRSCNEKDPLEMYYPTVSIEVIDHFVGNQDWEGMEAVCE